MRYRYLILSLFIFLSTSAFAEFELNKVRSFLSIKNTIDTFKVTNPDKTKVADLQAQISVWTQKDGQDIYTPTTDLIVAPPMMKIPPKKTQLLRVGWRQPTPLLVEKTYRLFLQEITPLKPLEQTGVNVRLRLNIPIFITPAEPLYQLQWQVLSLSGNQLKVGVRNTGNVHVQVLRANLKTADGTVVGANDSAFTLLAGQGTQIAFNMNNTATKSLQLIADTDYVPMQATITIP